MRVAAIDVGTNTVRLLVSEDGNAIERAREIPRLGKGVDAQRRLDPDAMERALDVIERFSARARELGAQKIRIAGTSALRDSADRDTFVEAVRKRIGFPLHVLTGDQEARLSFLGATHDLPPGDYVVCDIGGGSTEIATSDDGLSVNIGSVRVKERFLRTDPPTHAEVEAAWDHIQGELKVAQLFADELVGVAGTVTTVAALALGLDEYDERRVHHSKIDVQDVVRVSDLLLGMPSSEIAALGPVEPGRADVVAGGSLILRCVMERWTYFSVLVSERDILDGLVVG